MIQQIEYQGIPGCFEITNGEARLVIPATFGPRLLFYGAADGDNVLGWHGEAAVETELGTWKPYGGHRLWVAPEHMPLSYAPDNSVVEHTLYSDLSLTVSGPVEPVRLLQKHLTVTLDDAGTLVTLDHRITNLGGADVEMAAWALTIMRPGGEAVIPNEPAGSYGSENLLPVRSMALWPYTDLTDPRWTFGKDDIRLRCDPGIETPQKFGVLNKQGWTGYQMDGELFVKRFDYIDGAAYPDMNSNTEIYTAGGFIEVESLSPLRTVGPGSSIKYQERWELLKLA